MYACSRFAPRVQYPTLVALEKVTILCLCVVVGHFVTLGHKMSRCVWDICDIWDIKCLGVCGTFCDIWDILGGGYRGAVSPFGPLLVRVFVCP